MRVEKMVDQDNYKIRKQKIVPLPPDVIERWNGMRAAIDTAARPFTGSANYALDVRCVRVVIGAEEAIEQAFRETQQQIKDVELSKQFVWTGIGPVCEISWWTES